MTGPAGKIWEALEKVMDPEIPVISLVEMGIIRSVAVNGSSAHVGIAPTFSGCPALAVMQREIEAVLTDLGYARVSVEVILSPPWTTDWISESGRARLKAFGIAPPPVHLGEVLAGLLQPIECPYCGSVKTSLRNNFGATPCRMIFTCNDCRQPFEQFKPL